MSDFWEFFSKKYPITDQINDGDLFIHGTSSKRFSKIRDSGYLLTKVKDRVQQISQNEGVCIERVPKKGKIIDVVREYAKNACENDGSSDGIILEMTGANLRKLGCEIFADWNKPFSRIVNNFGIPVVLTLIPTTFR